MNKVKNTILGVIVFMLLFISAYPFVYAEMRDNIAIYDIATNSNAVATDSNISKEENNKSESENNKFELDGTKFELEDNGEFKEFLESSDFIEYTDTYEDIEVSIQALNGAFEDSVEMELTDSMMIMPRSMVGITSIYSVDITFSLDGEEQQPSDRVLVTLEVPNDKEANKVYLIHKKHNGGMEVLCEKYNSKYEDTTRISGVTESFSSYSVVYVNEKYNAVLMRDVLPSDYEIETFKADIIDYDPIAFNESEVGNNFRLKGYTEYDGPTTGINCAEGWAKMGIVGDTLVNNLPVMNYSETVTGEDLFGTSEHAGKTVYEDVDFEFILNKATGWYEYKSTSNHAQLDKATNRVELYADTLSPVNNTVGSLNLSAYGSTNDMKSIEVTPEGGIQGVSTSIKTAGRLDPYVYYNGLSLSASTHNKIYIKAKLDEKLGANDFKIYFTTSASTSYNEAKSITADYDKPNGDWMDIVIDTSDNSSWTGTITGIRLDPFDTSNGVLDETLDYSWEIEKVDFIGDKNAHFTTSGFYPFADIRESYPGNGEAFNISDWESTFTNDNINSLASRSITNAIYADAGTIDESHLWFGMHTEFDFYLPVNRTADGSTDQAGTADNLRFEFNGDDDLWVFVDGKLALDIGGGHGAIYGYIDFTDGVSYVDSAVKVLSFDTTESTPVAVTTNLDSSLLTPGYHTVSIFYMERCGSVSNCFMKFNLSRTPTASVAVGKEAIFDGEFIDEDYTFSISVDGTPYSNSDFVIIDKSTNEFKASKTNVNGNFSLKSGEQAFFDIAENKLVTVKELDKYIDGYKNTGVTLNGQPVNEASYSTVAGDNVTFEFINTYTKDLVELEIVKYADSAETVIFNIKELDLDIVMHGSVFKEQFDGTYRGAIKISDIAVGNYIISECTEWQAYSKLNTITFGDTKVTDSNEISVNIDVDNKVITFKNIEEEQKWIKNELLIRNVFGG